VNEGAVGRPAHLVGAAALLTLVACSPATVTLEAPDLTAEAARSCQALVVALPETVADQARRDVAPADVLGAAWGDPAIELVCGVGSPDAFDRTSTCTTVNDVDWFIPEEQLDEQGDLTMTVVNREQYVEVRMPAEHWPPADTLADLADAVKQTLPSTGTCY